MDTKLIKDKIVSNVIQKFITRSDEGMKKYNTSLWGNDTKDLNEWINEAQEEAMDFILYLEKIKHYKNG